MAKLHSCKKSATLALTFVVWAISTNANAHLWVAFPLAFRSERVLSGDTLVDYYYYQQNVFMLLPTDTIAEDLWFQDIEMQMWVSVNFENESDLYEGIEVFYHDTNTLTRSITPRPNSPPTIQTTRQHFWPLAVDHLNEFITQEKEFDGVMLTLYLVDYTDPQVRNAVDHNVSQDRTLGLGETQNWEHRDWPDVMISRVVIEQKLDILDSLVTVESNFPVINVEAAQEPEPQDPFELDHPDDYYDADLDGEFPDIDSLEQSKLDATTTVYNGAAQWAFDNNDFGFQSSGGANNFQMVLPMPNGGNWTADFTPMDMGKTARTMASNAGLGGGMFWTWEKPLQTIQTASRNFMLLYMYYALMLKVYNVLTVA